jgi:aspartyl-tRNA(Asn)/glutamyl-tRNA(Gln) amidotransferase subunit A
MVRMAMGSDTGGSIRGPAAYCGTVGMKPTYGRVSRRGVFPLSTTLDHCGPLTRSVEDAAITLQVVAGHDRLDNASANVPVGDYLGGLNRGVGGLRIGIPRGFFANSPVATREVLDAIDRTANALRDAGAVVEDVALPDFALFAICGRVIMLAEAFAIHEADMRERPLDFGAITFQRFILGATMTAADLFQALRVRRELAEAVNAALDRCDVLLAASALAPAPRFDTPADPRSLMSPVQTMPFNVTGHPALSVPIGLAANGLPIGLQIVGRPFDEATVLRAGRAVEILSGWEKIPLPL